MPRGYELQFCVCDRQCTKAAESSVLIGKRRRNRPRAQDEISGACLAALLLIAPPLQMPVDEFRPVAHKPEGQAGLNLIQRLLHRLDLQEPSSIARCRR